jgi:hypothetical protein
MQINFSDVDSLLPFRCLAPGGINSSLSLSVLSPNYIQTHVLARTLTIVSDLARMPSNLIENSMASATSFTNDSETLGVF